MAEVPAIRLNGLTEAQRKALRIADNQLALNAGWDDELLKIELEELQDINYDLDLLGFNLDEIEELLNEPEEETTEEAQRPERKDLSDEVKEAYQIVIECVNEVEQEQLYYRLIEEGLNCRTLIL